MWTACKDLKICRINFREFANSVQIRDSLSMRNVINKTHWSKFLIKYIKYIKMSFFLPYLWKYVHPRINLPKVIFISSFRFSPNSGKIEHYRVISRNNKLTIDEEEFFHTLVELVKVRDTWCTTKHVYAFIEKKAS